MDNINDQNCYFENILNVSSPSNVYKGERLTGIDFPVGALGGSVIRMNGKAERTWWHIFNNYEERPDSGFVPNSFFAIRTKTEDSTVVRTLQTSSIGPFNAMESLIFQGEYPFGQYNFIDGSLHADVKMEVYNPLIPADLKNSGIPCAIFRIIVKNPSDKSINVSLLASQQNAVGFDGYGKISGENNRCFSGYGSNRNEVISDFSVTSLKMTGNKGSMQLSVYEAETTFTASWSSLDSLFNNFIKDGALSGCEVANSPSEGVTVDGAIARAFVLSPNEERTVTYVLSWYIPDGIFGRKDIPEWRDFKGEQYENWWKDASDVDKYVRDNFTILDLQTRLFHGTLYSSKIPRYVIDRISSNLCVLKSPTSFWAKNGYFGLWESTSSTEEWFGNCKHVYHYAQSIAWIYPELARKIMLQNLNSQTESGLLPSRDGELSPALDGHLGTILGLYREHLISNDNTWLDMIWDKTKKAMDFAINTYDSDLDGMLSGVYSNTLDCSTSGTNPWIGSLYLAALKACIKMADIKGDIQSRDKYNKIFTSGAINQDTQLWNDSLNYYTEKSENLPGSFHIDDGCCIDMFLGQWWANQLNLGQIYPKDRTFKGLYEIYKNNKFTDTGVGYAPHFRDFLGTGDTGWMMIKFPGPIPTNNVYYYDEVMSGFEYAFAAALIQYGMTEEGLTVVNSIAKRYDGRFRGSDEVYIAPNATVFGTGSPFGEDECGDFYGRPLSSWSILTALQGYSYNGPEQSIGFKPKWMPHDHSSFFTSSEGWGLFSQIQTTSYQESSIEVKYGKISIKQVELIIPDSKTATNITARIDNDNILELSGLQSENVLTIYLNAVCTINTGSVLSFSIDY